VMPSLGVGSQAYYLLGTNASTNNAWTPGFHYQGSGSSANYVTLGLFNESNSPFTIFGSGNNSIGNSTDSGNLLGVGSANQLTIDTSGNLNTSGTIGAKAFLSTTIYSAAGTALPTCASGIKGEQAVVSDATSPTYMGAYTSGGTIMASVICSYDGTTYSWKTH